MVDGKVSKTALPKPLQSVMRKSVVFQMGITAGFETLFVLGTLSAQRLTGFDRIFGLSVITIFAMGQLIMSFPAGKLMDRYGRKPILVIGAMIESVGLLSIGLSISLTVQTLFLVGLVLLGLGSGAAQLAYLIGGDIYPDTRRSEGLGLMTTFTSIGVVGGTYFVGLLGDIVARRGMDGIITPWFVMCAFVASVALLLWGIRIEPMDVSRNPQEFYPGSQTAVASVSQPESRQLKIIFRQYPAQASLGLLICFQGVRMSIISLLVFVLHNMGYSLSVGAIMVAAMGLGMIAAAYPSGLLSDRWGRKNVLLISVMFGFLSAIAIPNIDSLSMMFVLLFILGCAFSSVLNITRTIFTDVTNVEERGRVMATSMITVGVAVIIFPTLASYVLEKFGWPAIAWVCGILMIVAFVLISFLQEEGVGKWHHHD